MDGIETQYDKWVMEEVAAAVQAIRLPDPSGLANLAATFEEGIMPQPLHGELVDELVKHYQLNMLSRHMCRLETGTQKSDLFFKVVQLITGKPYSEVGIERNPTKSLMMNLVAMVQKYGFQSLEFIQTAKPDLDKVYEEFPWIPRITIIAYDGKLYVIPNVSMQPRKYEYSSSTGDLSFTAKQYEHPAITIAAENLRQQMAEQEGGDE